MAWRPPALGGADGRHLRRRRDFVGEPDEAGRESRAKLSCRGRMRLAVTSVDFRCANAIISAVRREAYGNIDADAMPASVTRR